VVDVSLMLAELLAEDAVIGEFSVVPVVPDDDTDEIVSVLLL
jgi:hypothetical protein